MHIACKQNVHACAEIRGLSLRGGASVDSCKGRQWSPFTWPTASYVADDTKSACKYAQRYWTRTRTIRQAAREYQELLQAVTGPYSSATCALSNPAGGVVSEAACSHGADVRGRGRDGGGRDC